MFCVFWLEDCHHFDKLVPKSSLFEDMKEALEFSMLLRNNGKRFVTMSSEVAGNTTLMGVSPAPKDYRWEKVRNY